MTSNVTRRIKAGLIAFTLLVAQVVLPVSSAYATNGPILDTPTDGKISICHRTNSATNPYSLITVDASAADGAAGNSGNDADHFGEHKGPLASSEAVAQGFKSQNPSVEWGDIIPPVPGFHDGQNWTTVGQAMLLNGCNYVALDAAAGVSVTPPTCESNGVAMVTGLVNATLVGSLDQTVGTHSASFTATAGHLFQGSVSTMTVEYTILEKLTDEECGVPVEPTKVTPDVVFIDVCGTADDSVNGKVIDGISYQVTANGLVYTVVASPISDDYALVAGNSFTLSANGTATRTVTLTNSNCPQVVVPCETSTGTTMVTRDTDFADYQDTRSKGHYEFTEDGLRIYTDDNSSQAKVAWYHGVDYALSAVGVPAMDYTATSGIQPGMQLVVDFDGNGTPDGTLVGEAAYDNDWWLTDGSAQFVKDNAPSHAGGSGSANHGTLNQWLTNFPTAQVKAVGFSLGSGVLASGVLKSLTFGCYTWTFKAPVRVPTQCTVTNNLYIQPWMYDGEMNPSAGGAVPGTFKFMADGLHLSTSAQSSYVYGMTSAGNTPIRDIDDMSYMTYRDITSTGNPQVVTAYLLYVDLDGSLATDDGTYLFYEPIYNGTVQTGVWQTWDVDADSAKFWSFDLSGGNPSLTWAGIVDAYPNAVATSYGFNQGTYNQGTNARIQNMVFDCATTVFGVPGSGGGEEEPTTPTVPTTPVVPTPVVAAGGSGALLPEELPMTGENGSILFTWIALLAAILTYGSVYYLQPKKRFEQ